jgi:ribonuclease-3
VIRKIYNYYFSAERTFTRELTKILGFVPRYLHFYHRAFTHKSTNGPKGDTLNNFNNERLEYLGDAILDAVMAEYLFKKYPMHDEGFLTQMRSKMVNRKTLNKISADMGLDVFLRQRGTFRVSQTMMGNTFEAFVGAIYLDVGYKITKSFIIHRILKKHLDVHFLENLNDNFKSLLLEYCQKHQKSINYELLEQSKTQNNREKFRVAVLLDNEQFAEAEDFNKKSAEQEASRLALVRLGVLESEEEIINNA